MQKKQNNLSNASAISRALAAFGSRNELPQSSFSKTIININGVDMVDARKLHRMLQVGKDFATWIKDRIAKNDFRENEDWFYLKNLLENQEKHIKKIRSPKSGSKKIEYVVHNRTDYVLTVDVAKEFALLEQNALGREARRYFIAVEKLFKAFLTILSTSINGVMPIYSDGKIGIPRKAFLLTVGRSPKNGYRLRHRFPEDCMLLGNTACITLKLANLLQAQYNVRQMEINFNNPQNLIQ